MSNEYGVSDVTIYGWIKKLSAIKISVEETMIYKELQAMKKCIAELEMENEIFKKATAIFTRKH